MLEIIIVTVILIVLFEMFLRILFKLSMFATGNRDVYVYILGAALLVLIIIFVRPLLNIPLKFFIYGVLLYVLMIAVFAVVPLQKVKDPNKRLWLNIFSLVISGLLIFIIVKVIGSLIAK